MNTLHWFVLALACRIFCTASQVDLIDSNIYAAFNVDPSDAAGFGSITHLSKKKLDESLIVPGAVWTASFVTENTTSAIALTNLHASDRSVISMTASKVEFLWANIAVEGEGAVNVSLCVTLWQGIIEHKLSFATASSGIGLWDWVLYPAGKVAVSKASNIFENTGFGVVHSPPSSFSGAYPEKTMQFMASYTGSRGVYVAAHDAQGASKAFSCRVDSKNETATFTIGATPPRAGLAFNDRPYEVEFPVAVTVFDGDWWDAAQVYRSFVLKHAVWTKQGPMSHRDGIPSWLYNLTTWINSHWQQNDIFNTSGGDPSLLLSRVLAITKRLNLSSDALALHWYEWDALGYEPGSNYTKCTSEVSCGFDTHYPEYFPAREGFRHGLNEIQNLGVRVVPYINGRVFDKGTKSWMVDHAISFAAKKAIPTLNVPRVSTYEEQYGSKAKFAVMCPHTNYWQDKIVDVVQKLTGSYGTDGVYIDQIAAAGPRPCWDKTHNHTQGGGDHWVSGYRDMLKKARAAKGNNTILLTESNSEPFIGVIDMFLTLVGFDSGHFPSTPSTSRNVIVTAFQSVYGGYVIPVGAEYFRSDFIPDPNVFSAKIAINYCFGAQMGWFSLGGRDNQKPAMGIFAELMDDAYDNEVLYLQRLSQAKQTGKYWFNHGRTMRALNLTLNGSVSTSRDGRFGAVMSSAWLSEDGQSLLLTATTIRRHTPTIISTSLNLENFGFVNCRGRQFNLWWMPYDRNDGQQLLGTYPGDSVQVNFKLGFHDVALLRIEAVGELVI